MHIEHEYKGTAFCPTTCPVGHRFFAGNMFWGDGTWGSGQALVEHSDPVANVIRVRIVQTGTTLDLEHTYPVNAMVPGSFGPTSYNIFWGACCRINRSEGHWNNPGSTMVLQSRIDLAQDNRSPVGVPATQVCPGQGTCTFTVAASDPDGEPLTYRLATRPEAAGSGAWAQPGPCRWGCGTSGTASIDPNTGEVTWQTTGVALAASGPTYYSMQVMVGDGVTEVPVEFLIRVMPPPTCAPQDDTPFAGEEVTFTSTGGNLWSSPGGTPATGTGPKHATTYAQPGTYDVAVSNAWGTGTCSVTVLPGLHGHVALAAQGAHVVATVASLDWNENVVGGVAIEVAFCDAGGSCQVRSGQTAAEGTVELRWKHVFSGTFTACVVAMDKQGWDWDASGPHGTTCETITV